MRGFTLSLNWAVKEQLMKRFVHSRCTLTGWFTLSLNWTVKEQLIKGFVHPLAFQPVAKTSGCPPWPSASDYIRVPLGGQWSDSQSHHCNQNRHVYISLVQHKKSKSEAISHHRGLMTSLHPIFTMGRRGSARSGCRIAKVTMTNRTGAASLV